MFQFTKEQRIFIVNSWIETKSCPAVIELFRQEFPDREPPTRNSIRYNVRKYHEKGTSLNVNKNNSGRPRTGRSVENVERVRNVLLENRQGVSCRRNTSSICWKTAK